MEGKLKVKKKKKKSKNKKYFQKIFQNGKKSQISLTLEI